VVSVTVNDLLGDELNPEQRKYALPKHVVCTQFQLTLCRSYLKPYCMGRNTALLSAGI
jgi:hypothetical protein